MVSASTSGLNKAILFHPGQRINQRGLRFAPKSLLSLRIATSIPSEADKEENRGFLDANGKGLVVKLGGFRLAFSQPMQGLPEQLVGFNCKPKHDPDRYNLLLRDSQGSWYVLKPNSFDTWDRSIESDDLCSIISGLTNPWILYDGPGSMVPEGRKGYYGLLVEAASESLSQSKKIPFAEIKAHVSFALVSDEIHQICQAAYSLAQILASSAAAARLRSTVTNAQFSIPQEILQDLDLEIQRLSRSPFAMEALFASGNGADDHGSARLCDYIERICIGLYLNVDEYASGSTKWCVD